MWMKETVDNVFVTLIICSHRKHCIYTLEGAVKLFFQQVHCANKECSGNETLMSPESELTITMPRVRYDWNLFLFLGFRRFKRHWEVNQIQQELIS